MAHAIAVIRGFNRSVTRRIGALDAHYLGRKGPLVESRMLFEIGADGVPVRDLRARLGLDSGFVSRMLRSLERQGLVRTVQPAGGDGRIRVAQLTSAGRAELRKINKLSDSLAQSVLAPLTADQGERLITAMAEVERLLQASGVELRIERPSTREAKGCLNRYFEELAGRFRGGFDPGLDGTPASEFAPPQGRFLVARLYEQPIGCGALKLCDRRIGEIKRLWVAPQARGLGIARRMIRELESIARSCRLQTIRLDTNESLTEARALYASCGYREVDPFNDNPYAHHWFEKPVARWAGS
jgi:DNA-binding MarR family transcriptional regulator/ribosomal protein S18 acetylase RimI-like enzyme